MSFIPYYLYILKSIAADKFYIGISKNPATRLEYHNTIEKGFTSRYRPWAIVFSQGFNSKKLAMKAEQQLKRWKSRKMIEKVIKVDLKL